MNKCLATVLVIVLLVSSCVTTPEMNLRRFEFTRAEMGLPFRIVLYTSDEKIAADAAEAAFARIKQLNDRLSDYDSDSELSKLSQTSGKNQSVPVSDDLWRVLKRSHETAEQSGGAFDITVGPVVNLWRKARREKRLPDRDRLAEARARVGYGNIVLDDSTHSARLLVTDMRLDLGAIAKGYAADEALKVLSAHGVTRALVTGGGDMAAADPPPGKKGWRIEVAPLDITNSPPARFVLLRNRGLATSGDLFQFLEIDGKRYSHIVDPHTGIGLTDHSLVTVTAKDGITADALSTAVSVLGPADGIRLVERTPGAAAHIVRQPNGRLETAESKRFQKFYER